MHSIHYHFYGKEMKSSNQSPLHTRLQQPTNPNARENKTVVLVTIGIVCSLIFGVGGYFLGTQSSFSLPLLSTKTQPISPMIEPSPQIESSKAVENLINQSTTNCNSTYSSKYLKLSFAYDCCKWEINEERITNEPGLYSSFTATHKTNHYVRVYAHEFQVSADPYCYEDKDMTLLEKVSFE